MMNPLGYCVAILATTSFVLAGGEGDKKGGEKAAKKTSAPSVLEQQWSSGAALVSFQGDNHSMNISTGIQTRVSYNDGEGAGGDVMNVSLRTARSSMSGHAYNKNLTYRVSNEWTEGTSVKEGWLNYQFHATDASTASVRVGQGKTGFGREWNTEWSDLEFLDRSVASRTFANNRTRGVTLHGTHAGSGLNWGVAMHNNDTQSDGEESDNDNNEMDYTFNVSWSNNRKAVRMGGSEGALDGEGGFGAGIAHHLSNSDGGAGGGAGTNDDESDATNLWASWKGNNLALNVELFTRTDDTENGGSEADSEGMSASLSWTATAVADQAQWGVGIRLSTTEDVGAVGADVEELELILNRYSHGHGMKSQLGLTHTSTSASGSGHADNYLLALQTTVVF